MLKEIRCEKLIEPKLTFTQGLNTLTGPEDGTNSIGKSYVLMLIDFAFGGSDFLTHSRDVIDNIGHLQVEMDFEFDSEIYTFSRSTQTPDEIYAPHLEESPDVSKKDFTAFLKQQYQFPESSTSFREAVSPSFRIWGRQKDNPLKPLDSIPGEAGEPVITRLMKLFSYYAEIEQFKEQQKSETDKKATLTRAQKEGFIKSIRSKTEYKEHNQRLAEVQVRIKAIREQMDLYIANIQQLVQEENLKLYRKKNSIISEMDQDQRRLERIRISGAGGKANQNHFRKVREFFSDIDDEKILQIEGFHSGISKILNNEIKTEMTILNDKVKTHRDNISGIDSQIRAIAGMPEKPNHLQDMLLELTVEEKSILQMIEHWDLKQQFTQNIKDSKAEMADTLQASLQNIAKTINDELTDLIHLFYTESMVAPEIELAEQKYVFHANADSGTGKAYTNMIALDLALIHKTYIPVVIHDLIMFKNIEIPAIEKIVAQYKTETKQIFVAFDELGRYNEETLKSLKDTEFLHLNSERLAFGISWKDKKKV